MYFSFIRSYLNYENVAWGTLIKLNKKQLVRFQIYKHKYQSRLTQNVSLPETKSKNSEFKISYRGPYL